MATATSSTIDIPADTTILDAITFVATLVSKTSEVDPQLDRVRTITAQRSAEELTKEDKHTLREVYSYLEDYLIKKEALRSFTRDSIREQVYDYLHGKRKSTLALPLTVIWGIALGGVLISLIAPASFVPTAVKPTLAATFFFVAIYSGAAWMFWTGLTNFKDEIRRAYLPICLGIALVGMTLLQTPIAVWLEQDTSVVFRYITSGLVIPIAETLFYIGMRRFAQLGGVRSKLLSGTLVFGLCVGLSIVANILPRSDSGVPGWIMIVSLTLLASGAVLTFVTAIITGMVRQSLSLVYKRPMAWLVAFLLASTFSCVQYAFLQMTATTGHPYAPELGIAALVLSAFIGLKAGISFRQIDTTIVRDKQLLW
jgi:hypothetical protein